MDILFVIITSNIILILLIVLANFSDIPRVRYSTVYSEPSKRISVLLPVKNNQSTIKSIIENILLQDHRNFELLIYDDHSTDNSSEIIKDFLSENDLITLVPNTETPNDWHCKNWAFKNLSAASSGNILLMLSPGIELRKNALSKSLFFMNKYYLDAFSLFPTTIFSSHLSWLISPIKNFFLLSLFPLNKVFSSRNPEFSIVNDQYLMLDKDSYFEIGGHKKVKNKSSIYFSFAKILKKEGKKILTILGDDLTYIKTTRSFNSLSMNLFSPILPNSNVKVITYIIFLIYTQFVFVLPIILSYFNFDYIFPVMIIVVMRIITSIQSHQNIFNNVIMHLFQMILILPMGIYSLIRFKLGKK